jgi:hypothetical protein
LPAVIDFSKNPTNEGSDNEKPKNNPLNPLSIVCLLAVAPVDANESSVEEVDADTDLVTVGVRGGVRGAEPRSGAHE